MTCKPQSQLLTQFTYIFHVIVNVLPLKNYPNETRSLPLLQLGRQGKEKTSDLD